MVIRLCRAVRAATLVLLLAGAAPGAHAAGFSIFEQGARGMGFAGAFVAVANDPSAIFHNAGGIGFLKGKNVYLGGTLVSPSFDFTGQDPFPGAGVVESSVSNIIPIPALYYTHQFSETVVFGVGVHTPFGLRTEWEQPDQFTGRFLSQRADLKSVSVNPTVGFRLADRLSLGVGFDVRLAKRLRLQCRAPREALRQLVGGPGLPPQGERGLLGFRRLQSTADRK
jgi:long-chain fatty acid transport protein